MTLREFVTKHLHDAQLISIWLLRGDGIFERILRTEEVDSTKRILKDDIMDMFVEKVITTADFPHVIQIRIVPEEE